MLADQSAAALAGLAQVLRQHLSLGGRAHAEASMEGKTCDAEMVRAADDLAESRAATAIADKIAAWRLRLPDTAEDLVPWLLDQPQDTLPA